MKSCTYLLILFLLCGSIPSFAQNAKDNVVVLPVRMAVPADAKKLGNIKVGNNATSTHCDYEVLIADAKDKARAMGGNLVKITKLIEPAFISKCYKIEAAIYAVNVLPDYHIQKAADNNAAVSEKQDYATLYIYRLADTLALEGSYHIHLNDSDICTVKSKSRDEVKVYKEGPAKLWAKPEKEHGAKLDLKFGSVYYVRCGLIKGEIRMVPVIEVVDNTTGAKEYGAQKNKKNMKVTYLNQVH